MRSEAACSRASGNSARDSSGRSGARARSLGEISDALERAFGRYETTPTPVSGIYGKTRDDARWDEAVAGTVAVAARMGRAPRMLVAKMGQDGHDRGANLVSSAFGDLGFEIVAGPLFQTPREAAELAVDESGRRGRRVVPRGGAQDADPRADRAR